MPETLEKFIEAFKEGKIEQFVNELTGDELKNILIEINRYVRQLGPNEGGIFKGDRMIVGECISPKGEIQEKYFDKMVDFLKSINNKEEMATGMFYLINYLHLFQDGNGRTSRFVYEAMTNDKFEDYDGDFFKHEQGEKSSKSGFCNLKGIRGITSARYYTGYATYQYLSENGFLPDDLKDKHLFWAQTYINEEGVNISEKALEEGILTSEVGLVNRALKDNNESFSVGALSILMMMKLKGKNIEDYRNDCKLHKDFNDSDATRLTIDVYDELDGKPYFSEVLSEWTREDYLRLIKIADKVKEMLLDVNMDIIQYKNDFMCENGKTFFDVLRTIPSEAIPYKEDATTVINSKVSINPETRIFKNLDELKSIIKEEQIKLTTENIGVIELGKQTLKEQQDTKAKKDEADRRNSWIQKKQNTVDK